MAKTKDTQQLGDFIKNGKVGWITFTDKKSNNVHALCKYYNRVATCTPVKLIEGETMVSMLKVEILE